MNLNHLPDETAEKVETGLNALTILENVKQTAGSFAVRVDYSRRAIIALVEECRRWKWVGEHDLDWQSMAGPYIENAIVGRATGTIGNLDGVYRSLARYDHEKGDE